MVPPPEMGPLVGQHKGKPGFVHAGGYADARAENAENKGRVDLVAEEHALPEGRGGRRPPPEAQIAPKGIEEHPQDA